MLALSVAGVLTSVMDLLSWGGWYTIFFTGLPAVGLLVAVTSRLSHARAVSSPEAPT